MPSDLRTVVVSSPAQSFPCCISSLSIPAILTVQTFFLRTNTVVLVDGSGHATYVERTMEEDATDPDEAQWRVNTYEFEVIQETSDCSGHKSSENLTN